MTSADTIIADIKDYFENGKQAEQSDVAAFHERYLLPDVDDYRPLPLYVFICLLLPLVNRFLPFSEASGASRRADLNPFSRLMKCFRKAGRIGPFSLS